MNQIESRTFLKGQMPFTPQRMMRYIRSRARLATDEDIEDILQTALMLVVQHFDPSHPSANLALYCLGACNKAIAQNLERYHKVVLRKRADTKKNADVNNTTNITKETKETSFEGKATRVTILESSKGFTEEPAQTDINQWRTVSLDSLFDEDDSRQPEELFGFEYNVLAKSSKEDFSYKVFLNDLIKQVLNELPEGIHRTCFILKYVQGYKREDLISCLKVEAKCIDTVDKKIVRTLATFRDKLAKDGNTV
jgi:DNA-directed RNA polymerase specialized sigma24 family protein